VDTFSKYVSAKNAPLFVEGITYSVRAGRRRGAAADADGAQVSHGVVMTGELADADGVTPVNDLGMWYKVAQRRPLSCRAVMRCAAQPWFYTHVREFLADKRDGSSELIPLRAYYHRHSRSIFW
jgi:hypothetical protein